MMQPSSSTRTTIASAEIKMVQPSSRPHFPFAIIVWESNNAGKARGQSWNESPRSRWIPGGSCGYTSGTKRKHFAALSSPRPCWRWLQLQPSFVSPQCMGGSRISVSNQKYTIVVILYMVVCQRWLYHYMLSVSYISRESWCCVSSSQCSLVICANNRVHYGQMVVFVSLQITLPHYYHYADVSESIELLKMFIAGTLCRVRVGV